MKPFIPLLALVFIAGCATIITGPRQQVTFRSTPTAAVIVVDGNEMGRTPTVLTLTRKDKHVVSIELDGYSPYEMTFERKANGWIWGNIFFGGLIGLAVDAATGSIYSLSPGDVSASLQPGGSIVTAHERLQVDVVLYRTDGMTLIGQLERQ